MDEQRTFRLAPFPCPHCGQNVIVDKGQISDEGDHIAMTVGKALNYDAIFGDVVARKDAEWHEMRDYAVRLRDTLDQHTTLLTATHALLTIRLRGQLDTPDGLRAWNDLLAAHDALAEQTTETRPMHETELVVDMPNMELLVDTPNPGWHTAPGGGYGDMHGAGGHLATPKRVPVDNATTIRAVEHRIAVTRHEIATLQANLAVDEEWLNDLKQDG